MTKQQGVAALMVLTDDEAREIRERLEKATPGEWFADGNEVRVNVYPGVPDGSTSQDIDIAIACYRPNRDFIAHAPTDIARLLSAREANRKEIERLKTAKIEAATMADQAARREERERCAGIVRAESDASAILKPTFERIARAIEASDEH